MPPDAPPAQSELISTVADEMAVPDQDAFVSAEPEPASLKEIPAAPPVEVKLILATSCQAFNADSASVCSCPDKPEIFTLIVLVAQ